MEGASADSEMDPCPDSDNTILVVEDNSQAAKLLTLYLTQAGYDVLVTDNGVSALTLASRCRPLAITLDLLLPGIDGWEVLSALKASPLTRDIPVVIISVLDRQSFGFRLGASEYLVKPVERTDLLHALRRCVRRDGENTTCYKVMVVHSDPDELNLLALILAQENYEVIQALGVEEAASLARCAHPDLVVTNLLASGMDCFALLEGLKSAPETVNIPVLALAPFFLPPEELARTGGGIEFVLMQENEIIEERLLAAISLLLMRDKPPSGEN